MKKIFVITLSLSVIALLSFQNKDNVVNDTPSSLTPLAVLDNLTNLSDSIDIDLEMQKLQAEMSLLEKKMAPHQKEMHVWEEKMRPHQEEMKLLEKKMKPYQEEMKALEKKMKGRTTEEERETISKEMSKVGDKMSGVGDEMSKVGDKMSGVGDEMSKIGDKMSAVGDEMSKIGDKMSIIGDKMEKRHRKIFSWFFQELKRDGLLTSNKCSIMMEEGVFMVNGQSLSKEQMQKYKKGIEERLGKALKADFSIYFKGIVSNITEEGFDFDGNMNSNY